MKAAAMFAAAYGFPPSACGSQEEALGLFQNMKFAMAVNTSMLARAIAVCFSQDANADLMQDFGANPKDIARVKLEAMRQKAMRR